MSTTTAYNNEQYNTNSNTSIDPEYLATGQALYDQLAAALADYKYINAPQSSAYTADQLAAQEMTRGLTTAANPYTAMFNDAGSMIKRGASFTPTPFVAPGVTAGSYSGAQGTAAQLNRGDIRNVTAKNIDPSLIDAATLQRYVSMIDPSYTNSVIDTSLNDLNRARQMTMLGVDANAARQGAFGGTRLGVAEGETNRGFGDAAARTTSGLRQNMYDTAIANMQNDLQRQQAASIANTQYGLQADSQNQGVDASTAQSNAQMKNAMEAANMASANASGASNASMAQAANAASAQMQFNAAIANQQAQQAAAQLSLQGGVDYSDLAQRQYGNYTGGLNLLNASGLAQQNFENQKLLTDYNNQLGAATLPLTKIAMQQAAWQAMPFGTSTEGSGQTSGNSTSTPKKSWMDILGTAVGSAGAVAGSLFSDARLKENIKPMSAGLDMVRKLKPVSYNWKHDGSANLGFTAQHMAKVIPEAVHADPRGIKGIDPLPVLGVLAQALKELDRKVSQKGGK